MLPKVAIVVLNTNRRDDTLACLASLQRLDYPYIEILVVDNASTDGSVSAIPQHYPGVTLIESGSNLGYVGGNNLGIKHALACGADYVLILNEDTIVDRQLVRELVAVADSDSAVGVVGPKVYYYDMPDVIQSVGGGFTRDGNSFLRGADEVDQGQYDEPKEVDWISGCAMLVKRRVLEQIGLFDPAFFMSWEDTDYCVRVRRAGYKVMVAPAARLWHKGAPRGEVPTPRMVYYRARNRLLFLRKNGAGWGRLLSAVTQNVRTLLSWSVRPKWRDRRPAHRNALMLALLDFCRGRTGYRGDIFP